MMVLLKIPIPLFSTLKSSQVVLIDIMSVKELDFRHNEKVAGLYCDETRCIWILHSQSVGCSWKVMKLALSCVTTVTNVRMSPKSASVLSCDVGRLSFSFH